MLSELYEEGGLDLQLNQLTTVKRSPRVTGATSWTVSERNATSIPGAPFTGKTTGPAWLSPFAR